MGLTVYGGGGKPEEEKTVTAGTSVIEVNPSSGKAMKKVTVNPTPTESKVVTAGTEDITVSPTDGKHLSGVTVHPTPTQEKTVIPTADGFKVSPEIGKLLSAVFVDGDSDLVGENIKQGVNIFGVDGSFDNSHGAYVWKKLTADGGDFVDFAVNNDLTAYPDGGTQDGYWYEKVVEGIDLLSLGNYTKLAVDKFTLSATPTTRFYINHSFGARPKAFIIFGKATEIKGFEFYAGSFDGTHLYVLAQASGNGRTNVSATSTDICLSSSPSVYFEAGVEYTLITMA